MEFDHLKDALRPPGVSSAIWNQVYSNITGSLATTQLVRDGDVEAVSLVGGNTIYTADYNPQGESNWAPWVVP